MATNVFSLAMQLSIKLFNTENCSSEEGTKWFVLSTSEYVFATV